jgi:curved DNA-binding protein CbpA
MNTRRRAQIQVATLHEILPEIDYYRILQLDRGSRQADIDKAYRRESRRLHPDRFAALQDADLSAQVTEIHRTLNEAYEVLRDPDQRIRYDRGLSRGHVRLTDDTSSGGDGGGQGLEEAASTPKGEKYWRMALAAWEGDDFQSCIMQIQFALSFEPDNEVFQEWLEKAKLAREESGDEEKNAYKIRLVR